MSLLQTIAGCWLLLAHSRSGQQPSNIFYTHKPSGPKCEEILTWTLESVIIITNQYYVASRCKLLKSFSSLNKIHVESQSFSHNYFEHIIAPLGLRILLQTFITWKQERLSYILKLTADKFLEMFCICSNVKFHLSRGKKTKT